VAPCRSGRGLALAIVTGTSSTTEVAHGISLVGAFASLVRFQHTVFALPFALAGALLAEQSWPRLSVLCWILLAMVGARSLAMALNRLIDEEMARLRQELGPAAFNQGRFQQAVGLFRELSLSEDFEEFLTLPALPMLRADEETH